MRCSLSLLFLACASVSSAPSRSGGSPQEQVSLAAGDPLTKKLTVARALRGGRQKRRPCAKSIATCDYGVIREGAFFARRRRQRRISHARSQVLHHRQKRRRQTSLPPREARHEQPRPALRGARRGPRRRAEGLPPRRRRDRLRAGPRADRVHAARLRADVNLSRLDAVSGTHSRLHTGAATARPAPTRSWRARRAP